MSQYLLLDGSGDYAAAPDSTPTSPAGDLDLRARVALDDWTPANPATIYAKWNTTGNQRAYKLSVSATGNLVLETSSAGSAALTHTSTVATGFTDGTRHWVRATIDVNDGGGNRVVRFYVSDTETDDPEAVVWTQLGTTVTTAGATTIFNSTASNIVGGHGTGTTEPLDGKVWGAFVYSGIDGALIAAARFAAYPWEPGMDAGDTGTDLLGNVWTLNGNATIVGSLATCVVTSPEWIGDLGIVIELESFANALEGIEIAVYAHRPTLDVCPPPGGRPLSAFTVDLPAGSILTIDGAREDVYRYDKAAARVAEGLSAVNVGADLGILEWPTVGGHCRSACVVVDYPGSVDPDSMAVTISTVARET